MQKEQTISCAARHCSGVARPLLDDTAGSLPAADRQIARANREALLLTRAARTGTGLYGP